MKFDIFVVKRAEHMKNILLLILFCLSIIPNVKSQSLQIEDVVSNFYDPIQDAIAIKGNIRNTSTDTLRILVKSNALDVVDPAITFFCWAQCYSSAVIVSPSALVAPPNGLITEFHGYYRDNGVTGLARVNYTFFVEGNEDDSLMIEATFDPASVGISEVNKLSASASAYPNPANEKLNIAYKNVAFQNGASLEVFNMLGVNVGSYKIRQKDGIQVIAANQLKAGVYFYMIREAGKTSKASRFTVKH